jgi:hypothetical protein
MSLSPLTLLFGAKKGFVNDNFLPVLKGVPTVLSLLQKCWGAFVGLPKFAPELTLRCFLTSFLKFLVGIDHCPSSEKSAGTAR